MQAYVYGFEAAELEQWPADIEVARVDNFATAREYTPLVILHDRALDVFADAWDVAHSGDRYLPPNVILYRTSRRKKGSVQEMFVDATVRSGHWDMLRKLLASCPYRYTVLAATSDAPLRYLHDLLEFPDKFRDDDYERHLPDCESCRKIVEKTLGEREIRLTRRLHRAIATGDEATIREMTREFAQEWYGRFGPEEDIEFLSVLNFAAYSIYRFGESFSALLARGAVGEYATEEEGLAADKRAMIDSLKSLVVSLQERVSQLEELISKV